METKIRVSPQIVVGVKVNHIQDCPAGSAYWSIDYLYNGLCVHSATTGAIYGTPNPIAMLDREYTRAVTHYQDIPNADPEPKGDERKGRSIGTGSSDNRPAWFEHFAETHRQAIIDAIAQLVIS